MAVCKCHLPMFAFAMPLGVTDMAVVFRNLYAVEEDTQPLSEKLGLMKAFAENVIAKA